MFGNKKSEPLLTLSPEDFKRLQEMTAQLMQGLNAATAEMQDAAAKMNEAAKAFNKANAELKKTQKRTIIRNH